MINKSQNYNKTHILIGIAGLILFFLIIGFFASKNIQSKDTSQTHAEIITNTAPSVSIDATDVTDIPTSNPFAGRYVTYQGITKIETADVTYLINPSDNDSDVYMEFVVSENGEVIYSSELIAAGKGIDVNFPELLSEGEHILTVTMNPYLEVEGEYLKCPVNNAQDVTVNM